MISLSISYDETVVKNFATFIKNGCLAHGYLFVGPEGIGKAETALGIAKLINCERPREAMFCDECAVCAKINNGNHPDMQIFEAITADEADANLMRPRPTKNFEKSEKRSLRIEQVRYLNTQTQFKPFEARKKIFIVKDIENLTLDAANALLKTLEEPTPDTLLLLTTAQPENVLGTIKSRCQMINFFPLAPEKLEGRLTKEGIKEDTAHFLACFSEGCLGKAERLNQENIFQKKNEAIDNFVYTRDSGFYIDSICADSERAKEILAVLLAWFRDLVLLKSGIDAMKLIHRDRLKDLQKLKSKYSFDELTEIIREIVRASKLLEDNLNIKIALILIKERLWRE